MSGCVLRRCALRLRQRIHFARKCRFLQGASLRDPARLLQGAGKFMCHVKLRPQTAIDTAALHRLIEAAYSAMKARVERGSPGTNALTGELTPVRCKSARG